MEIGAEVPEPAQKDDPAYQVERKLNNANGIRFFWQKKDGSAQEVKQRLGMEKAVQEESGLGRQKIPKGERVEDLEGYADFEPQYKPRESEFPQNRSMDDNPELRKTQNPLDKEEIGQIIWMANVLRSSGNNPEQLENLKDYIYRRTGHDLDFHNARNNQKIRQENEDLRKKRGFLGMFSITDDNDSGKK